MVRSTDRYRWVAALLASTIALTAVGCTRTTTPSTAAPTTAPGANPSTPGDEGATSTLEWSSCGGRFECATLDVPLDHADPTGPTIELALSRRPASEPDERIGSLLVNPGGPGASGIGFLRADQIKGDLADHFDLVAWDPRGIGDSSPLRCEADFDELAFRELDSDPDTPEETAALDAAGQELAQQCATTDLALLQHSDTSATARDLDLIRQALGEATLSYLGFSYGTQIGEEYARLFPANVRAMVLDGVVDPAQSLQDMLRGQTVAIDGTFSAGTLALLDRLLARVEVTPLRGPDGVEIGPGLVTLAAVSASYSPDGDAALAQILRDALDGKAAELEALARQYTQGASFAAYLAVTCTDSPFEPGPAAWERFTRELDALSPRFGAAVANELIACAYWPVSSQRQPAPLTTAGLPPVLVIGTTGDAATPYASAERVAAALPGAVLLTLDGEGHTAFGRSDCIDDAVDDYLIDLETPPPGTVCR